MKKFNFGLLLAIILCLTGALLIGGTSYALFSDTSEASDNIFVSGDLSVTIDRDGESGYFNLANLLPGDHGSDTITISNTGNLTLSYNISAVLTGELAEGMHPLVVTIHDSQEKTVSPHNQRLIEPNQKETLRITWQMPIEAGNEYQGKTAQMSLIVQASQSLSMASVTQ